ncbi:GNAT family N-acetyltransferase [Sphingopyxis sp.]|uniref:GNAT family N-acetyltransferase n=1 Tax=Sphingopyxis sp. TaxID=1908224 RepID=UPI002D786D6E|nr:GNAT family N-acetyltransferase [Sphingopyxis sp.]HET6526446.1 GNAT family N-acetyltransferase [Sphingopyxis sp.]
MQGNGEDQANDDAARAAGFAAPFDRAEWFDLLAAHGFAGQGRIDARGSAHGTAAWLPLRTETPGHLAGLTNWYSFAIRPLFSGRGDHAAALTTLFHDLRAKAARLSFYPLRDEDRAQIASALRDAGWWVKANPAGDRHWLDLSDLDHDGWWASRPGALRSTVQRKAKKGVVAIELLATFDPGSWAAYEQIYAASWKPEEGHPALLRAFAEMESARGTFRMGIARIEGAPVAAQFWTVEGGTAFIHKLAHVEDSLKASPGTLLSAALFRHVIEVDGVKRVDFGTGNDAYKRDWMNRHEPLWRIEAFNPSRLAAWGPALKAFARSLLRKDP